MSSSSCSSERRDAVDLARDERGEARALGIGRRACRRAAARAPLMPPSGFLISCARPAATAPRARRPGCRARRSRVSERGRHDVVQAAACCRRSVAVAVDHRRAVGCTMARRPKGAASSPLSAHAPPSPCRKARDALGEPMSAPRIPGSPAWPLACLAETAVRSSAPGLMNTHRRRRRGGPARRPSSPARPRRTCSGTARLAGGGLRDRGRRSRCRAGSLMIREADIITACDALHPHAPRPCALANLTGPRRRL